MIKGGYTEAVGGIVMMIASGNAKEIVSKIKDRVEEINSGGMLPDGLRDRSVTMTARSWWMRHCRLSARC